VTTVTVNEEIRHIVIEDENSVTVVLSSVFAGTGDGGGASALAQLSDVDNAGVAAQDDVLTANGDGRFAFRPAQIPDHTHSLPDHDHPLPDHNHPAPTLDDLADVDAVSQPGDVLTAQSDGSYAFEPAQLPAHIHPAPTWTEVTGKPEQFQPTLHSHSIIDIPDLPAYAPADHSHHAPTQGIRWLSKPPETPSAYDDEFNDSVLSTEWIEWQSAGWTEGTDGILSATGSAPFGLRRTAPAGPWTLYARIRLFGYTVNAQVGLAVWTPSDLPYGIYYVVSSNANNFGLFYATTPTGSWTQVGVINAAGNQSVVNLRIHFDGNAGGNIYSGISLDGESWITNSVNGYALPAGETPMAAGVISRNINNNLRYRIDCMRFVFGAYNMYQMFPCGTI